MSALKHVSFRIDSILASMPDEKLRQVALAACTLAVEKTALQADIIENAIQLLRVGHSDANLKRGVDTFVEELDEVYWDSQDRQERGEATEQEVSEAFFRARAAASVASAMESDPKRAANLAVYEAYYALNEDEEFLQQIASMQS